MSPRPAPDFGALLHRPRRVAGLTQEELAERASISVNAISAMERGLTRAPHKDTIALLAEALQLSQVARAELVTAARGRVASVPAPTRDTPIHLVRADEDQAEPEQPAATEALTPASFTPQVERPSSPESASPPPAPLPARRQSKRIVLRLAALLILVAGTYSGLGYGLHLWPFGKNAPTTATPVPTYAYVPPTYRGGTTTFSGLAFPQFTTPGLRTNTRASNWPMPSEASPTPSAPPAHSSPMSCWRFLRKPMGM